MALHFSESELAARRERAVGLMQKRGLDGLLMFRQESMYYLTGYDTFGYVYFQCLYLGADGRDDAADPRARPAAGPEHLGHQGHPRLDRRAARQSRRRSCAPICAPSASRARRSASSGKPMA